jgi:hypothetical protein
MLGSIGLDTGFLKGTYCTMFVTAAFQAAIIDKQNVAMCAVNLPLDAERTSPLDFVVWMEVSLAWKRFSGYEKKK